LFGFEEFDLRTKAWKDRYTVGIAPTIDAESGNPCEAWGYACVGQLSG